MITIYTDGSAHPNPGPGGWGAIVLEDNELIEVKQFLTEGPVTNNRMEMEAILWAIENYSVNINSNPIILERELPIIYTDSSYALNTFTIWMFTWERNGWRKSDNTIPENLDLVKKGFSLVEEHRILFKKVKGHSTDIYNNIVDQLATGQITEQEVRDNWKNIVI